ncbi:MAG: hypothetical protein DIU54_009210 [Acidobacteriota bacterium]|jgi:predicted MFS family arabinose efflux permease|nr:MAG: hypothetical protein DIU54_02415 [Acidobacteriota bacterium]
MSTRRLKDAAFALTAVNTVASYYYFTYLFFYLRDRHGFGDRGNLWVAALHGAVYIFAAWFGGRFAARRGYAVSLAAGFAGLALSIGAGLFVSSAAGLVALVAVYTVVLLLTWPALEALVTHGAEGWRVSHAVGLYNLTWSGAAALGYFTGGPLYDWLGAHLIFTVPAVLCAAQCAVVAWLARGGEGRGVRTAASGAAPDPAPLAAAGGRRDPVFLRLGWMANPLAYTAIYTLLAVMPGVATDLGLTPTEVGLYCSVWMFARLLAFGVLWRWHGWHYRFRFLAAGYLVLMASFVAVLLASSTVGLIVGQIVFGLSAGLMYYSSLFYSMDLAESRAEHGGLHEAGVGVGICAGPAIGAASLDLFPSPEAGTVAVTLLLAAGFAAMVRERRAARRG